MKDYLPNEVIIDVEEQVFDRNIMILNTCYRRQNIDGIWLERKLNAEYADCQIIYVSDHPEIDSSLYEVRHCYLIRREQLAKYIESAVRKALTGFHEQVNEGVWELVSNGRRIYIRQRDILYIERKKREIEVVTVDKRYLTYEFLRSISTWLQMPFVRCHARYIVNLEVVDHILEGWIRGLNGHQIPLGRTYTGEVRRAFRKWWEKRNSG